MRMSWKPGLVLAALLLLAYGVYWPGLSGAFLFDDFGNLPPLGDYGPIQHAWQAWAWITSGFAGPTGRPIALASFLLDTRTWPVSPEGLKHTNLLIHLFNGLLLAGLLHALARGFGLDRRRAAWVAVLAAGLWLLHPLWVSTTLYVIQRMAMLAALFVFAGLWAFVQGRLWLRAGKPVRAYVAMSLGLALGTLLATLSKENGALLPLLAWLIEAFVFDADGRALDRDGRGFVWWRRVFVYLPSALLLAYLAYQLPLLFSGQTFGRDFTPAERLLTETRILWDYLRELWLPGLHDGGLFNDDIRLSTSLWQPLSTLFATLGLLGLIALAVGLRWARAPLARSIGLALGFYLVGQVLESSVIPLELMFEHRNYLPAGLMFLPLALWLVEGTTTTRRWPVWVAIALCVLLAGLTAKRAELWGKPFTQALVWAQEHPHSARAQSYLANFWEKTGNYPAAEHLLNAAFAEHPDDLLVLANRAFLACEMGSAPPTLAPALLSLARRGDLAQNVTAYQFDTFLGRLQTDCPVFGADFAMQLVNAALHNPTVADDPTTQRSLLSRRAQLELAAGQPLAAYDDFIAALRLPGTEPGARLLFAATLAGAHQQALALKLLNAVPTPWQQESGWSMAALHRRIVTEAGFYQESEAHLRRVLQEELAAPAPAAAP
ncbi:tetratricopeptide repeat protein [Halothiobacillus sp. DCM-1]|uniref:tetratricopeptide repeat protein n=1 Tax=Halothiobacillus sp. DCM-1 TaxID=3112558 RepID=UPI0032449983